MAINGEADGNQWHLDRRVPVAIIITLIVQLVGFGMMIGNIENRVKNLETASSSRSVLPERMARLEERLVSLQRVLERIDRKLDGASPP